MEYRLDEKSLMGTQKRGAGEAKKNQISTNMHIKNKINFYIFIFNFK